MKIFYAEHQVRGYELDGYGHVNNAVYLNYAEYARWRMIEEATGGQDYFEKNGCSPVVARIEIDYKLPCYLGEWLRIETSLVEHRKKVAVFRHLIVKKNGSQEGRFAAEIRATLVVVGKTGKTAPLPESFLEFFSGKGSK